MDETLLRVINSSSFYRDNFRRSIRLLYFLLFIILGLFLGIGYLLFKQPLPNYYATTLAGQIAKLAPLEEPNLSDAQLVGWAQTAVESAFTINFVSYEKDLNSNLKFFSPSSQKQYLQFLAGSPILSTIKQQQLVITAESGDVKILNERSISGKYRWTVELPVKISIRSAGSQSTQQLLVRLDIIRLPILTHAAGVVIDQFAIA